MTSEASAAPDRKTYTRRELARVFGVSLKTLDSYRDKLPPAVRIGTQLFWDREAIHAFLRGGNAAC